MEETYKQTGIPDNDIYDHIDIWISEILNRFETHLEVKLISKESCYNCNKSGSGQLTYWPQVHRHCRSRSVDQAPVCYTVSDCSISHDCVWLCLIRSTHSWGIKLVPPSAENCNHVCIWQSKSMGQAVNTTLIKGQISCYYLHIKVEGKDIECIPKISKRLFKGIHTLKGKCHSYAVCIYKQR